MSITAKGLFISYKSRITLIISDIKKNKEAAIPGIIASIATDIVPSMMTDVGKVKSLSGTDKRDLILESITLGIDEVFDELNRNTDLGKVTWDDTIHKYVDMLLPSVIKLLISVENDEIRFNKKISSCFSCC